ncbi:MAG TPA: AcvB/VirJ family lysyl-phosphatidylglycerol hydrolase [Thermoanaerobaculia bacterium]|nr:AcvB/VirJ family lysyl-phosphatidylglycerol hydrolase [Thermoanaerobaculia bacterium]
MTRSAWLLAGLLLAPGAAVAGFPTVAGPAAAPLRLAAKAAAAGASAVAGRPSRSRTRGGSASAASKADETLSYGRFGTLTLYRQTPQPKNVVLFFSGDGGWNLGVVDMAKTLSSLDALVVGINLPRYLKALGAAQEACSYPASDLELLSKYVQKKLAFPAYTPPVLVGYSSGATLVYAVLVQAPPNTFRGAISMGFCPDLPLSRPLCSGHGLTWSPGPKGKGYSFKPAATLEQPWIAFQGEIDQVCFPKDVQDYVRQVNNGEAVMLPKVGHGFSVPAHWEPQFKAAFQQLTSLPEPGRSSTSSSAARGGPAPTPAPGPAGAAGAGASAPKGAAPAPIPPVADLPLIEVPAPKPAGDLLAVVISGDGGWAGIDREVAAKLAEKGVPVVGLNSLKYFWNARDPAGAAADLERIVRHYLAAWNRREVMLIGYSLGADVLPFMASRLPPDLSSKVRLITLLGPSRKTSFQFHLTDWLPGSGGGDVPVLPEVTKLRGKPLLCFYGEQETDSLCTEIAGISKTVETQGAHHFGRDYATLADRILREVQAQPPNAGR